jgi:serine/threonine-protein kinase
MEPGMQDTLHFEKPQTDPTAHVHGASPEGSAWQGASGTAGPAPVPGATKATRGGKTATLGDYRLLKKLGSGSMGDVYKAREINQGRDVAVKVLYKHLAAIPSFLHRFHREARLMARLDHPNIVRCIEVGAAHGFHYLVMELIDGLSLEAWRARLGRLPVPDAVHIALACARALQHAHERNLVHRDVKPDNVLITSQGVVKVADLGLAKIRDEDVSLTQTGTGAGTPLYMSPEQARNAKHVDGRSDIYSLGCMLYGLLTGVLPFNGSGFLDIVQAKEKGVFPPARRLCSQVPDGLDRILARMITKNPDQRYQSCADLIQDLEWQELARPNLSFVS